MTLSRLLWICLAGLLVGGTARAADRGIVITPGDDDTFVYEDDFKTGRFLDDAFRDNLDASCWQSGAIVHAGPTRQRMLTYRFHGSRRITKLDVVIDQMANARHLGGTNTLYLSSNGLDWTQIATSRDLEVDSNHWTHKPLTVTPDQAKPFLGKTEIWVRLVLVNYSGLKTSVSSNIDRVRVAMTLGKEPPAAADPQARARAQWGKLRKESDYRTIALDWADPVEHRPPHYYEDADGWLRPATDAPHMAVDETNGFVIQRTVLDKQRSPLSLAAFINVRSGKPLMACVVIRADKESSRELRISAAGKTLATLDVASYFETDRAFYIALPPTTDDAPCELRLSPADAGRVLIRRISLTGPAEPTWTAKPALPEGGKLDTVWAGYLPDPKPSADSQSIEGRSKRKAKGIVHRHLQRMAAEYADFGMLRAVVRNTSSLPVRITDPLKLNGKPIGDAYVDFAKDAWDARGVVWYRIRPKTLLPGDCAEITVRFRRRPEGNAATLRLPIENGPPLDVAIPYTAPPARIDYVAASETRNRLYAYVQRTNAVDLAPLRGLLFDGKPAEKLTVHGADYPGGIALAVVDLDEALPPHSYHTVAALCEGTPQPVTAAQFRVMPFFFSRGSIHTPPELCNDMHMNTAMWRMVDEATCKRFDLVTTCFQTRVFDAHDRVAYIFGPDEPDAKDNRGGGYDRGLGYHARMLMHSGWGELVNNHAPHVATWLIMNGTTRPLNWGVYGQVADVCCFDPYPVTYYAADHAFVRESLTLARLNGRPRPMYACLEAYGWSKGQGVPSKARGPIPAEYRQNVVQAIGAGMKGLTSWVYVAMAGGWQLDEPVKNEIAKCNRLIEHIEGDLLIGTPVDLATCDAGKVPTGTVKNERWQKDRVWVQALLCGPDTIVVAAANHIPASKPDPPRITPAENVTVIVRLPNYLKDVVCFEATEDGLKPQPITLAADGAKLHVDRIESGRVFVLRRK